MIAGFSAAKVSRTTIANNYAVGDGGPPGWLGGCGGVTSGAGVPGTGISGGMGWVLPGGGGAVGTGSPAGTGFSVVVMALSFVMHTGMPAGGGHSLHAMDGAISR